MRLLLLVTFLITNSIYLRSQSYVTGGEPADPVVYQQIPQVSFYTGSKTDELPYQVDLLKNLSLPIQHQGEYSVCTSMAVANAYAITYARQRNNLRLTSNELPSAWYLHRQTNRQRERDCKKGLSIPSVLEQFKSRGTIAAANDLQKVDCRATVKYPAHYRIKDYSTLFGQEAHNAYKASQIKSSLAAGKPVIFNIPVDESFTQLSKTNATYSPQPETARSLGTHTMTIVGYIAGRKKAYKVLNSWGEEWGMNRSEDVV